MRRGVAATWLEREVFTSGVLGGKSTRETQRERVPKALLSKDGSNLWVMGSRGASVGPGSDMIRDVV